MRLHRSRSGRSTWSDAIIGLGVTFLLLAVIVFVLLAVNPWAPTPTSWDPVLLPLGGIFGIGLVGLGIYHRRTERRR